jgi:hypothetical protein
VLLAFPLGSYGHAGAASTWNGTWARGAEGPAGNLILLQIGTTVTGHYTWNDGSGTVSGSVSGATFTGGFNETHYEGSFVLTLSAYGKAFSGSYSGTNRDTNGDISGPFTGTCIGGDCLHNGAAAPPPGAPPPPPPGQSTTISEPKPGTASSTVGVDQGDPTCSEAFRAFAAAPGCKETVTVTDSAGNLNGTAVVAPGGAEQTAGQAVAACWLIGPDAIETSNAAARSRLDEILGNPYTSRLFEKAGPDALLVACMGLVQAMYDGVKSLREPAAAGSCVARPVALAIRTKNGKVSLAPASLPPGGVRYGCGGSGGSEKITIAAPSRAVITAAFGSRLRLGVVRGKNAPARAAMLTFAFSGGGSSASVTFTQGGSAVGEAIAAPTTANDLEANIDPHSGAIANAYWTKAGKSLGPVSLPGAANGLVFRTSPSAIPGPAVPRPAAATGFHVFWNTAGAITSATWTRVGKPLATIPVASGQQAIAFTSGG